MSEEKKIYLEKTKLNINYMQKGSGKDVVILHGWGCEIKTVMPIINALEQNFRVTAFDLPGFGKSDEPDEPYTAEKFADSATELIEKLEIEYPILIGHSNGGRTIIYMLGKQNFKASKVILIDSAGIKPKRRLSYYVKTYSYKMGKKLLSSSLTKKQYEEFVESHGSADYKSASPIMRGTLSNVVNEDLTDILKNIKCETLLIWGDSDTATPLRDGQIMEKEIKGSGLVVLKGCSHFSYLDGYNQFVLVLREFLKKEGNFS